MMIILHYIKTLYVTTDVLNKIFKIRDEKKRHDKILLHINPISINDYEHFIIFITNSAHARSREKESMHNFASSHGEILFNYLNNT